MVTKGKMEKHYNLKFTEEDKTRLAKFWSLVQRILVDTDVQKIMTDEGYEEPSLMFIKEIYDAMD